MTDVRPVVVPQVNVNDEAVRVVKWLIGPGDDLRIGDPVCIVETSKTATEIVADVAGVFKPMARLDEMVPVGAALGYVGPSLDRVERMLAERAAAAAHTTGADTYRATPRAIVLARTHQVDLAAIASSGVKGTIKESDVERFVADRGERASASRAGRARDGAVPAALAERLTPPAELSRHELTVIDGLRASQDALILTTLDFDVPLGAIAPRLKEAQRSGIMLSFQHLAMAALGRALPKYPRLMSFRAGSQVYTYREVDVAFVVRSVDGRLFTPVVRNAQALTPAEVARACGAAAMRVNRGRVTPDELEGACFTVSHIADRGVSRFVAVPNRFQSAILAIAASAMRTSRARSRTITGCVTEATPSHS